MVDLSPSRNQGCFDTERKQIELLGNQGIPSQSPVQLEVSEHC